MKKFVKVMLTAVIAVMTFMTFTACSGAGDKMPDKLYWDKAFTDTGNALDAAEAGRNVTISVKTSTKAKQNGNKYTSNEKSKIYIRGDNAAYFTPSTDGVVYQGKASDGKYYQYFHNGRGEYTLNNKFAADGRYAQAGIDFSYKDNYDLFDLKGGKYVLNVYKYKEKYKNTMSQDSNFNRFDKIKISVSFRNGRVYQIRHYYKSKVVTLDSIVLYKFGNTGDIVLPSV